MSKFKNILVTDDDGLTDESRVLFDVSRKYGNSYALFPSRQKSAVSKAITVHKIIRLQDYGDEIYTMNGTPADSVLIAKYYDKFPTPDLVLSGINQGDNAGLEPLLSSGTIGACWEALLHGIPSIAFSVHHGRSVRASLDYLKNATDDVLKLLLPKISANKSYDISHNMIYNVNFPSGNHYNDIVFTDKIENNRFDVEIHERDDPSGKPYLWIYGKPTQKPEKDSDYYEIVKNNNISIMRVSLNIFNNSNSR